MALADQRIGIVLEAQNQMSAALDSAARSAGGLGDSLYALAGATGPLALVGGALAIAAGMAVKTAGDLQRANVEWQNQATALGLTSQQFQALGREAEIYGASQDQLSAALFRFSRELQSGNKTLEEHGITAHDLTEGIRQLSEAFQKLPAGPEKAELAFAALGRGARNVVREIQELGGDVGGLVTRLGEAGLIIDDFQSKALEDLRAKTVAARHAWEELWIALGLTASGPMGLWQQYSKAVADNMKDAAYYFHLIKGPAVSAHPERTLFEGIPGAQYMAAPLAGPYASEEQIKAGLKWQEEQGRILERQREQYRRMMSGEFQQPGGYPPETMPGTADLLKGFGQAGEGMSSLIDRPDRLLAIGTQVAAGLAQVASSFVSGLMTLGQAFKAFWQDVVRTVAESLARLGLGKVLVALGGAIGGPVGAAFGVIGAGLIGSNRAGAARGSGGPTYVFQGLNTRDMFMAMGTRQGSLARANDLVALRAGA